MNIGDAARRCGLPAKTIRYYEESGLIRPAQRSGNGYRFYTEADVHILIFVRHARNLGFTVEECGQLLSLYEDKERQSSDVRNLVRRHLGHIDTKIEELERMQRTLRHLVANCHGDDRPDCPILDGIVDGE